MSPESVLIADDHAIVREGLRALLTAESDLEIIGEAIDGNQAIHHTSHYHPSILVMDLSMPHTNGPEAIRQIKRRNPGTKVVVLTMHKSEEFLRAALDAGADAYVVKDDTFTELLSAIHHVQNGMPYISPSVSAIVVNGYLKRDETPAQASWQKLTARERQVLKLIAEGYKNKQIATSLSLSLKTIEKHRSNLMRKLDLHNASTLTAYAIENGLLVK